MVAGVPNTVGGSSVTAGKVVVRTGKVWGGPNAVAASVVTGVSVEVDASVVDDAGAADVGLGATANAPEPATISPITMRARVAPPPRRSAMSKKLRANRPVHSTHSEASPLSGVDV